MWHVFFDEGVEVQHKTFLGFKLHEVCQVLDGLGHQLQRPVGHGTGQIYTVSNFNMEKRGRGRIPVTMSNSCGLSRAGQMNRRNRKPL